MSALQRYTDAVRRIPYSYRVADTAFDDDAVLRAGYDLRKARVAFDAANERPSFHAAWLAGGIPAGDDSLTGDAIAAIVSRLRGSAAATYCGAFTESTADAWNDFESACAEATRVSARMQGRRMRTRSDDERRAMGEVLAAFHDLAAECADIHRRVCAGWHAARLLELGPERLSPAQAWCLRMELGAEHTTEAA